MAELIALNYNLPFDLWGGIHQWRASGMDIRLSPKNWMQKIGHSLSPRIRDVSPIERLKISVPETCSGADHIPVEISLHKGEVPGYNRETILSRVALFVNANGIPSEWLFKPERHEDYAKLCEVRIPLKHVSVEEAGSSYYMYVPPMNRPFSNEPKAPLYPMQSMTSEQGRMIMEMDGYIQDPAVSDMVTTKIVADLFSHSDPWKDQIFESLPGVSSGDFEVHFIGDSRAGHIQHVNHFLFRQRDTELHLMVGVQSRPGASGEVVLADFRNIAGYWGKGLRRFLPQPYSCVKAGPFSEYGINEQLVFTVMEWFDGYKGLHVSRNLNGRGFLVWNSDQINGTDEYQPLSPEESDQVAEKIVEMFAYHYLPEERRSIGNFMINLGDAIILRQTGFPLDVKLTTVRKLEENVDVIGFMGQLFRLCAFDAESFIQPVPTTKISYPVPITTPPIVYNGLIRGLSNVMKFGADGPVVAKDWIREFAASPAGAEFKDEIGQELPGIL